MLTLIATGTGYGEAGELIAEVETQEEAAEIVERQLAPGQKFHLNDLPANTRLAAWVWDYETEQAIEVQV